MNQSNNEKESANIGFAVPTLSIFLTNYTDLDNKNKSIVNTFLVLDIFFLIAVICLDVFTPSDNAWILLKHLSAFLFAIAIAISLSIADKLNLLTPVQRTLHKNLENLDAQVNLLNTSIDEFRKSTEQEYREILSKINDYEKYRNARFTFGFSSIVGLKTTKIESKSNVKVVTDNFIIDVLESVPAGSHVYMLNTFMHNDSIYYNAMKNAVLRGVNLKVLFMKPDPEAPVLKARFLDYFGKTFDCETTKDFVEVIRFRYRDFDRLSRDMQEAKQSDLSVGDFAIRYYATSLNFPLLLVSERGDTEKPNVAFSGFYTLKDSEQMPYVEWRGGDIGIVDDFYALFQTKWDRHRHDNFIFPENAPEEPSI